MDKLAEMLGAHQGQVESSGVFTLDADRFTSAVLDLDAAYPFAYLVKLLQFAFAAHPDRLDISMASSHLELVFDPTRSSPDLLEQAQGTWLGGGVAVERRAVHLRHAIALLVARPDLELLVEEGSLRLAVRAGEFSLQRAPEQATTRVRVRILRGVAAPPRQISPPVIFSLFPPHVTRRWPEWTDCTQYLAAPPCPVFCNGRPAERVVILGQTPSPILGRPAAMSSVWATGRYGSGELPFDVPDARELDWALRFEQQPGQRGLRYLLRLARGLQGEVPRFWYVVQDGFITGSYPHPEGLVPIECWLDGSSLPTDATFLATVENRAWEELHRGAIRASHDFLHRCAAEFASVKANLSFRIAASRRQTELRAWAEANPQNAPAQP